MLNFNLDQAEYTFEVDSTYTGSLDFACFVPDHSHSLADIWTIDFIHTFAVSLNFAEILSDSLCSRLSRIRPRIGSSIQWTVEVPFLVRVCTLSTREARKVVL